MKYRNAVRRMTTRARALALMTRTLMCSLAMCCQDNSGQNISKDQKSKEAATAPASLSLPVDDARKTTDLPPPVDTEENAGERWGTYEVKQSAEFGGRISGFTGNAGVWDTFVNLGSGPRLLEYTLDLHSPTHEGLLFDDLSFSNYGFGGDPNNVSHLRVLKGTLYNFNANFRRDQNIFDY